MKTSEMILGMQNTDAMLLLLTWISQGNVANVTPTLLILTPQFPKRQRYPI